VSEAAAPLEPITAEIIQVSLTSIADEMFVALKKTAMSAIIYEVLDMGTGLTDADGELAASGCGIPTFMAVTDKAVKRILALYGRQGVHPGDLFISNDPYYGAVSHLNDVALLLPIFASGELVAWAGNIAHWPDIGGMTAGSMHTDARSIHQEGLRLPAVRLFAAGRPVQAVFDILLANTRLPHAVQGDLWAAITAVRLGERRVREVVARYGVATFRAALAAAMHDGEALSRKGLAALPKGDFELAETQESGAVWRVRVSLRDDGCIVDLRDNPDQNAGPHNLSRDGAVIAAQMIFKSITGPHTPCNGGAFRPLQVLTRPGSVFEPLEPAAHGFYFETRIRLHDLLWRCLATAMPDRLPAGHFASICSTVMGGVHPDTGRHYTIVEPQVGGWGACHDRDGLTAQYSGVHGDTFTCPAEIAEARHGLAVESVRLNPAPGGAGRRRGGRGVEITYRIRGASAFLSTGFGRSKAPPWGMQSGAAGTTNYVEVHRSAGEIERHAMATAVPLGCGDRVRIVTAQGGGFGDPLARPKAEVRADLRDGYVQADEALAVYGGV
jgi:N-methylhydantoinase B